MRHAGQPKLLEHVFSATIPMRGRMIHGRSKDGDLYEAAQDYDIHGRVSLRQNFSFQFDFWAFLPFFPPRIIVHDADLNLPPRLRCQTIFAVDRAGLNKRLLDILEAMPNVKFFFNHKLTGADFNRRKAWFEITTSESATGRAREIETGFDLMIGADGAHSAVRYHMMKFVRMNYQQEYIDTLWCEFQVKAVENPASDDATSKFRISPNHLHIWPGKEFMFIAIPSDVSLVLPPRCHKTSGIRKRDD